MALRLHVSPVTLAAVGGTLEDEPRDKVLIASNASDAKWKAVMDVLSSAHFKSHTAMLR